MKIRYVFLVIALFTAGNTLQAQSWFDENPEWASHFTLGFAGAGYEYVSIQGDTLLQGKTAKIFKRYHDMNAVQDFTDFRIARQSGDTVWCWNEGQNQFNLLYNFSLGTGDSVSVPLYWNSNGSFKYVIQAIAIIFVDGQSLRAQSVTISTGNPSLKCSALIIEKIGMVNGQCLDTNNNISYPEGHHFFLDEPNLGATDGPDWFFCRYRNNDIEYKYSNANCDALTGVDEAVQGAGFTIAPNPFGDQLSIVSPPGEWISRLRLFDCSGRLIKAVSNPADGIIPAADMPPGAYFIEIISGREERSYLKAIKQ